MTKLTVFSPHQIHRLVAIGFCQPKFYKRSVWQAAKNIMDDIVCPHNLAYAKDFGRGKGKYGSDLDIGQVQSKTVDILRQQNRVISQSGFVLVTNEQSKPNRPASHDEINSLPQRVIEYISYDETKHKVSVFEKATPLKDKCKQWLSVDDFICQCFVVDVAA